MLNVNEDTIRAYTEQNVPKKLTITFPNNSNLTPITNANIQEESMSLTGSLCSDSNLMLQAVSQLSLILQHLTMIQTLQVRTS